MSRDLNKVDIIGRLTRTPEIKYTPSGTPVAEFPLANNTSYKQGNEYKEYTNYFDVNVWGNQAINCEKFLKKGSQVAITGELRQNRWSDKTTNQTRSKIKITALQIQFLNTKNQQNKPGNQQPRYNNQNKQSMITDPWENDNNSGIINNQNDIFSNSISDDDIPF